MARMVAVMAKRPADDERRGPLVTAMAAWEGGGRADHSAGTYQRWYFDGHLADGAELVVTVMNKRHRRAGQPLSPMLRLDLDLGGGRLVERLAPYPPDAWSGAKDGANVRLGDIGPRADLRAVRMVDSIGASIASSPSWHRRAFPGMGVGS